MNKTSLLSKSLTAFLFFTPLFVVLSGSFLRAENLVLWISSFQDQVYYEKMGELYAEKTGKKLDLEVKAYGFREMPDKLGVAFRTGEGIPDLVQLDETFFGVFINGPSPFVDLTGRVKKSGLAKDLHPRRLEVFTYKGKVLGVPQSLSAMVLYYRKDLFKEMGVNPKDLETWAGLPRWASACKKSTASDSWLWMVRSLTFCSGREGPICLTRKATFCPTGRPPFPSSRNLPG